MINYFMFAAGAETKGAILGDNQRISMVHTELEGFSYVHGKRARSAALSNFLLIGVAS
jgi:hypothetical protein